MFHISVVRKDNKYFIRFINSFLTTNGIKSTAILDECKVGSPNVSFVVDRANNLVDALINAGMNVEPALGLSEEQGADNEN